MILKLEFWLFVLSFFLCVSFIWKEHVLKSGQQFYYKIVHAVHIQRNTSLYVYRVYNFIIKQINKLLATFQHMLFSIRFLLMWFVAHKTARVVTEGE